MIRAKPPINYASVFLFFLKLPLASVMLSKVYAAALRGVEAVPVEVEMSVGLPLPRVRIPPPPPRLQFLFNHTDLGDVNKR